MEEEVEQKVTKEDDSELMSVTHYTVSQHAAERFVERAWGYKNQTDKTKFANLRSTEIREFLNKLCTYGECIFRGRIKQYNETMVYKKDNWVVLVDPNRNNVVTCYPMEFDVGEDYNIEYVNRMSKKLQDAVENKQKIEEEVSVYKEELQEKISNISSKITEYKTLINDLQEEKQGYEQVLKGHDVGIKEAQIQIESIIESLTHKKIM